MQPESAMRGGADEREARAEADVVVSACAGGMLWGGGLTCAGGGGISAENELEVVSVAVRMGGRVGREFLRDKQCDEGIRPRHRKRW